MESRTLTCEGQLVATAEIADTYGYDTDQYDNVFLFNSDRSVRPGPELSPDVDPGGILSSATHLVGSLWATRYGHEAPVVIRVDDCGEIYTRLAEPGDVFDPGRSHEHQAGPAEGVAPERTSENPLLLRDALQQFAAGQSNDHGFGLGL